MTLTRLRPDGTYSNTWPTRPGGSADQVLADDNDFTYLFGQYALLGCRIAFSSFLLPAGAVVRTITPIVRCSVDDPTATATFTYQMLINNTNTVGQSYVSPPFNHQLGDTPPPDVFWLTGLTGNRPQSDIDGLGFGIGSNIPIANTHALINEVYCDVGWVPAPTVVVTGPTGTVTVNNPTVSWVHQPGADAPGGQDYYRVRVVDVANPSVVVYDTGNVAGAAASAVVGPLALQHTYRATVNTMQTTDGIGQWSPDASTTFTLDVTGPTTDVTAPTGVVGTTSPTIVWTHTPGAGAQTGQTFYRIRAYDKNDLVTPLFDSGEVASSAKSVRIGPLDPNPARTWRVVVVTAQTTYGALQWSAGDYVEFTIDAQPALITSVAPSPQTALGAISLLISRDLVSPLWQTIDVESSYDGGSTWIPVRFATHLSVNGATATVVDYEAPSDTPVMYRARATRVSGGSTITGPWTTSPSTSWHLAGNDVVIRDPAHPERMVRVCVAALPEPLYDRTVGVFRPVGAYWPVVVSDVMQSPSFSATVLTHTAGESQAFLEVVAAPVVLVQSPTQPWGWGSRYVALGAIQQTRTSPLSRKADRLWTIAMTEVARPADESAT
jgi:hypothetical protein